MFEDYKSLSVAEQAEIKQIHKNFRSRTRCREGNLAWAFVRGIPYRRVERSTHEFNKPSARSITAVIASFVSPSRFVLKSPFNPERPWNTDPHPDVIAWLANPDGAIPAPVRVKLSPEESRARHEKLKGAAE